jgi:hypothetical protein
MPMKKSNVVWVLMSCVLCFTIGWMLPSPLADAVRYASGASDKAVIRALEVFVDEETGCEYVGRDKGALMPRVGTDGKQVCKPGVLATP